MADQKISKKQSQDYLRELEELSKDPQYSRPDSPSTDALAEAMNRARQLQEKQATRNEWGQVAEMVGRALTKYGAAQAGAKQGVDVVSKLDLGPGIDWESRQRRAMDQYRQSVGEAEAAHRRDRDAAADLAGRRKEDFARQEGYLQTALRDAQQRERDEAQAAREEARLRQSLSREDARAKKDQEKSDLQERRMELAENNKEIQALTKQLQAQDTLANQLLQEGDLRGKSAAKLQEKYGALAAQAGTDLPTIQANMSQTDKPGILWGKRADPEARRQVLFGEGSRSATLKQQIDALRQRNKELVSRQPQQAASQPPQEQTPDRDATIENYAKQYNLTYEAAETILRGRGYTPETK